MLNREDWYDLATRVGWNFKYVSEDEVFPPEIAGRTSIPHEIYEKEYDAPYKVTYREYVKNQREKDLKVMAVKEAMSRGKLFEKLDPAYRALLQTHFGLIPLAEYGAAVAEARMGRFGRAAEWRHLATFGCLDEIRHGQIQLLVPHEFIQYDPKYAWAHKCFWTEEWGSVAGRRFFDDQFLASDALETPLMLNFAFEVGFTNLQFVAMAAQAYGAGDYEFGTLTQSIQTDEARHAQIGVPLVKILIDHGEREKVDYLIAKELWIAFRLIQAITGTVMDYEIPLEARRMSFKEFMQEWIILQLERLIEDLGITRPWWWDEFIYELDYAHHSFQIGLYHWRFTVWFDYRGPTPEERRWLVRHYPDWEEKYGHIWDTMIKNVLEGKPEKTQANSLVVLCNTCQLPCCFPHPGKTQLLAYMHNGRKYVFCSEPCRWIFTQEKEKFAGQKTVLDRLLMGEIQPPTPEGVLKYMGFDYPEEMGIDAWHHEWAKRYGQPVV